MNKVLFAVSAFILSFLFAVVVMISTPLAGATDYWSGYKTQSDAYGQ